MKVLVGFKNFITKGNILDLAIAVIMGGAFGKIVTSMINDIIFPMIAALLGEADFKDLVWNIRQIGLDVNNEPVYAAMRYGNFIQVTVEFLIIAAFIYFFIVQLVKGQARKDRRAQAEKEKQEALEKANPKPIEVKEEVLLLQEIRDLLKKKSA